MKTTRAGLLAGSAMLALMVPAGSWIIGVVAATWLASGPALADGGVGGSGMSATSQPIAGGAGGTATSPAGDGIASTVYATGGGGGAAGGGAGGSGGDTPVDPGSGGAGGVAPGQDGGSGTDLAAGGGGGAGGSHGFTGGGGLGSSTGALTGGAGGNGGAGVDGGGGGGGEGGYGAVISASGINSNNAAITGGNGGTGGDDYTLWNVTHNFLGGGVGAGGDGGIGIQFNGASTQFFNELGASVTGGTGGDSGNGSGNPAMSGDGRGGDGGSGLQVTTTNTVITNEGSVTGGAGGNGGISDATEGGDGGSGMSFASGANIGNSGSITGGNGGAGGSMGTSMAVTGSAGAGGEGITGRDLSITNSGHITGGMSGDGLTQADAIHFTGGTNSLILDSTSVISGNVVAFSTADKLILGGDQGSLDLSKIGAGAQYQGFGIFQKVGPGTWTLTGTATTETDWTISSGTLKLQAGASLDASSALAVNGGTFDLNNQTQTVRALSGAGGAVAVGTSTFTVNQTATTSYAGALSGSGTFVKDGSGTLTLAGDDSGFTGSTVVTDGTLALDTGASFAASMRLIVNGGTFYLDGQNQTVSALSGSGGTVDTGDGTLTVNQGTNTTYGGTLLGSRHGMFIKQGAGTLTLTGDSSGFGDDTELQGGGLEVGDASHVGLQLDSSIDISAGATLSGYGMVGDVTSDGTVSPGGLGASDFGTLTVNGTYTQNSDGTLRIIVTPGGASQLAVPGTANLDGTLKLVYAPGVYAAGTYTLVTAAAINGQFAQVEQNAAALDPQVSYDSTDVHLAFAAGNLGTTTVAPTDGQVMGATTSSLVSTTQLANQSLFNHLSDQRFGAGNDELNTAFAGSNPAQAAFAGDLAGLNNIVDCLPEALARNGGWFRGLGGFGSIDGSGGTPGIDSYGGGFMAGYDRALTDHFLLGVAAGYTRTQINGDDSSNASIDTPRVSLYGSYHLGGFALDSSVGYAFDRIKSQDVSDGGDAKSKHDAHEINAALQVSYSLTLPQEVVLTPHTGLDYLHIFEDGYQEKGAGAFDLTAQSSDTDSLRPQVGLGVSRSFATDNGWHLIPQLDLTYSREMLDNSHNAKVVAGGGSFTVDGLSPSRDQLALSVDLTAQLNDTVDLSLGYTDVLPVGNTASYNFTGSVRVLF